MKRLLLGLLSISAIGGCDFSMGEYCEGDWAARRPEEAPAREQSLVVARVQPTEAKAVDLLFVIDDSLSMADEQAQLGIWSNELFDVLSPAREPLDLHLAVVSSSVSIPGHAGCESAADGQFHVGGAAIHGSRYLTDVSGNVGRVRNYDGTLTDNFAAMALVGDSGCGFEQPFKATRLALSGNLPGSEGFLRDDALLLIVFVTDEDDCSTIGSALYGEPYADACSDLGPMTSYRCFEHGVACYDGKGSREFGRRDDCRPDEQSPYIESVSSFAAYLRGLKRDPGQIVLAGIYGKPTQVTTIRDERIEYYAAPRLANVCGTGGMEGTGATPAIRMNALMTEFPARASQSSICEPELSWAMREAGLIARDTARKSGCLRGALADSDPAAPGTQPSCKVDAVSDPGTPQEVRRKLPACSERRDERCFTIQRDEAACAATETQLAVSAPNGQAGETLVVRCALR